MSRLDSAIRRLEAQRDCLNMAETMVRGLPGPVLELGLGNGRTYDHLRGLFPERDIYVFERKVQAHPDCIPDASHLLLGDFRDTVPTAAARIGAPAALVHYDIGTGDKRASLALGEWLAGTILALTQNGTVLVGDQPLPHAAFRTCPLPAGVATGRYHIYQRSPNL